MAVDFQCGAVERFWSKVHRLGPDDCWPWLGAVDKDGYGVFGVSTKIKSMRANRVALILTIGDIGEAHALHTCDNPPCCNPEHLFPGNNLDNMRDRDAKGRHRCMVKEYPELAARGEAVNTAYLTRALVEELRSLYVPRKVTLQRLSDRFGLPISTVHYAIKVGWKTAEEAAHGG